MFRPILSLSDGRNDEDDHDDDDVIPHIEFRPWYSANVILSHGDGRNANNEESVPGT